MNSGSLGFPVEVSGFGGVSRRSHPQIRGFTTAIPEEPEFKRMIPGKNVHPSNGREHERDHAYQERDPKSETAVCQGYDRSLAKRYIHGAKRQRQRAFHEAQPGGCG
jgi:hypothetical protein